MEASNTVLATLVALNVKPRRISAAVSLSATMPYFCTEASSEWCCVMYTKSGARDAENRSGGPVSIIVQNVYISPRQVIDTPSLANVECLDKDKRWRPLRSAVCVSSFSDFDGPMEDQEIDLNSASLCAAFPGETSRRRFLSTVLVLLEAIKGGLARKYGASKSMIAGLLTLSGTGTDLSLIHI